jgi:hypothetical protein
VIRLPRIASNLSSGETFGLALLVDLSRLAVVDDDVVGDVVELEVTDDGGEWSAAEWARNGFGISRAPGVVRVSSRALRCATSLAGAEVEQRSTTWDKYGRVPSSQNALVAAGLEREPIVSRAAVALCDAALAVAGRRCVRLLSPWPDGRSWAVALTHDLDVVDWWIASTLARALELGAKRDLRRLLRSLVAAARAMAADPVKRAAASILQLYRRRSLRSTWFILAGMPTLRTRVTGDLTYRLDSRKARGILRDVLAAGHELGLHGSFATMESAAELRRQRVRLEAHTGCATLGVRQHFLRIRPGSTQRAMVEAGFTYDASFGFPDRNGFRLGVADVVPAWSAEAQHAAGPVEVPLMWMDRALSKYRKLEDPRDWVADALDLARTCRDVHGLWVGLWHPNMAPALGYADAPGVWEHLVDGLLADQPYVGALHEIVAWRASRRAARVVDLAQDGRVATRVQASPAGTPTLLDPTVA